MASTDTPGARKSQSKLLLALPILLVLAVVVNLSSIMAIVKGEKSLKAVVYGLGKPDPNALLVGWQAPPDTGAADAKVVVEVFIIAGDSCHLDTALMGQALGTIDAKRIRVKFVDGANKTGAARREKVKLGCDQGVAVNGKTEFKIPDPEAPGKQKTVFTAHQHGGGGMSLQPILDRELKAAYHGQGLNISQEQYNLKVSDEATRIREAMLAEAKAKHDAEKGK